MESMYWLAEQMLHGPWGYYCPYDTTLEEFVEDNEYHMDRIRANWGFIVHKVNFFAICRKNILLIGRKKIQ